MAVAGHGRASVRAPEGGDSHENAGELPDEPHVLPEIPDAPPAPEGEGSDDG